MDPVTIATIGLNVLGMFGKKKRHQKDARQAAAELQLHREQLATMQKFGQKAWDTQQEDNEYTRMIEAMNRRIRETERQFQIDQMFSYEDTLTEERQFEIDRQVEMDQEAARLRQFQIEQLLRNQEISKDERSFAEKQLAEAKAIASGERQEDLQRFYQEQARAVAERDFVLDQFYNAGSDLRSQQLRDLELRDRLTSQVDQLQSALGRASREMGDLPDVPRLSQADLDAEIARRQEYYMSDVDRAANRMASVNEADLIRGGIDSSSTGTARRAALTRELSDQYMTARHRAHDDALQYITGQQDFLMEGYSRDVGRRADRLSEVEKLYSAGFDQLRNLPEITSLTGLFDMARSAPSGVYTRGIESANDFNAGPLGSAIYDNDKVGLGLSNYEVRGSAAHTGWQGISSGTLDPYSLSLTDPAAFFGAAANGQKNILQTANSRRDDSETRRRDATGQAGTSIEKYLEDNPGVLSKIPGFDSIFGKQETSGLKSSKHPPRRPA